MYVKLQIKHNNSAKVSINIIMRPSSLGGGRILRRTLSVCPSVCLSVCPSDPLSLPSVTSRHLANYNDTHVLFGTRWGPHIVRPSRPHRFLFHSSIVHNCKDLLHHHHHHCRIVTEDRCAAPSPCTSRSPEVRQADNYLCLVGCDWATYDGVPLWSHPAWDRLSSPFVTVNHQM